MGPRSAARPLCILSNDVLKARPGENRKNGVVQAEKGEERAGIRGDARADAADHDRNRERQEEERQQQLACAARSRDRSQERPDRRDPDVRQRHRRDELPGQRVEEEREGGQRHDLGQDEEERDADRLAEPDRAPVARRQHEAVEEPLLALGREGARESPRSAVKTIAIQSRPVSARSDEPLGSAKWKIVSAETTNSSIAGSVSRDRSSSSRSLRASAATSPAYALMRSRALRSRARRAPPGRESRRAP